MKKVESLIKPTTKIQDLNLFFPRCHQTFVSSIGVGDEGHLHILTRWGLSGSCFQLSFNVRRNIPVPWSQGDSHRRLWTTLIIIEKAGQKIAPFWTSMISHSILHKFMLVHFPQKMFNAFFSKGNNSCGKANNHNPSPTNFTNNKHSPNFFLVGYKTFKTNKHMKTFTSLWLDPKFGGKFLSGKSSWFFGANFWRFTTATPRGFWGGWKEKKVSCWWNLGGWTTDMKIGGWVCRSLFLDIYVYCEIHVLCIDIYIYHISYISIYYICIYVFVLI